MKKIQSLLLLGEKVVIIGTSILAILLLVAERFPPLSGLFREDVPSVTLFLLSIFVLSFFAREQILTEAEKWKSLGMQAIYQNRNDPAQFASYVGLMEGVKNNLFIVGITLKDVPRTQLPLFLEKGKKGCSVELLMLNPRFWKNNDPILDPVAAATNCDLKADFQLAISHIRPLVMSAAGQRAKIEVRFYHQAPSLSLTIADGDSHTGRMRVELTPHNSPQHGYFRPMLDLQPMGGHDLFSQFYKHYRALWENSLPYLRVQDSKVWINRELDKEISKVLDLPPDWLPQELQAECS